MVEVVAAAGPGIVVNATEVGQVEQHGEIVGEKIVHESLLPLGMNGDGFHPLGGGGARLLLKKRLAMNAIGIAPEDHGAVLQEREKVGGQPKIVGKKIALGVAVLGEIDLVQMREAHGLAVNFEGGVLGAAVEKLLFDFSLANQG